MLSRTRCWRALWIILIWFLFFLMFVLRWWRWQMVKLLIALQVLPEHWCIVEGSWPHNLPHYVHIFIQLYIKVDVTTAFHLIHNWRGDVTYELQAKNGPPIFFVKPASNRVYQKFFAGVLLGVHWHWDDSNLYGEVVQLSTFHWLIVFFLALRCQERIYSDT